MVLWFSCLSLDVWPPLSSFSYLIWKRNRILLTQENPGLSTIPYLRWLEKWEKTSMLYPGKTRILKLFNCFESCPFPQSVFSLRLRVISEIEFPNICVFYVYLWTSAQFLPGNIQAVEIQICALLSWVAFFTSSGQTVHTRKLFSRSENWYFLYI